MMISPSKNPIVLDYGEVQHLFRNQVDENYSMEIRR